MAPAAVEFGSRTCCVALELVYSPGLIPCSAIRATIPQQTAYARTRICVTAPCSGLRCHSHECMAKIEGGRGVSAADPSGAAAGKGSRRADPSAPPANNAAMVYAKPPIRNTAPNRVYRWAERRAASSRVIAVVARTRSSPASSAVSRSAAQAPAEADLTALDSACR